MCGIYLDPKCITLEFEAALALLAQQLTAWIVPASEAVSVMTDGTVNRPISQLQTQPKLERNSEGELLCFLFVFLTS